MRVSVRAQCKVGRGRDGETRGQNAPNLGLVPFPRRPGKRLVILREQLLALLFILGLARDDFILGLARGCCITQPKARK